MLVTYGCLSMTIAFQFYTLHAKNIFLGNGS